MAECRVDVAFEGVGVGLARHESEASAFEPLLGVGLELLLARSESKVRPRSEVRLDRLEAFADSRVGNAFRCSGESGCRAPPNVVADAAGRRLASLDRGHQVPTADRASLRRRSTNASIASAGTDGAPDADRRQLMRCNQLRR